MGLILLIGCLVAQFRSIRLALIILLTVSLAASGVFPALLLSGASYGFISLLGLLGLMGIVDIMVNNGIVLIDFMLLNIKKVQSLNQSITNAFTMGFHGVLLTSLTTIVGVLSVAVSTSPPSPSLAWSITGGLLFSTLITLDVLPCCTKLKFTH